MMNNTKNLTALSSLTLALFVSYALIQSPSLLGQAPTGAPKGAAKAPDPRVQQRKYHFADTNEDLPYALFVSSKVTKGKKAPLIVALHGVFGDGNSLLRGSAIDLAEEGGYVLVGPMGYNPQGWYGSPGNRHEWRSWQRQRPGRGKRRPASHSGTSQSGRTQRKGCDECSRVRA